MKLNGLEKFGSSISLQDYPTLSWKPISKVNQLFYEQPNTMYKITTKKAARRCDFKTEFWVLKNALLSNQSAKSPLHS